jgi:hypothetical protein
MSLLKLYADGHITDSYLSKLLSLLATVNRLHCRQCFIFWRIYYISIGIVHVKFDGYNFKILHSFYVWNFWLRNNIWYRVEDTPHRKNGEWYREGRKRFGLRVTSGFVQMSTDLPLLLHSNGSNSCRCSVILFSHHLWCVLICKMHSLVKKQERSAKQPSADKKTKY